MKLPRPQTYITLLVLMAAASAGAQTARTVVESSGDVQDGERVIVTIRNSSIYRSDTLQLRDNRTLRIPGMPDLSLDGVPRAALDSVVAAHVAKYVRDPDVRVTTLLPLAVNGSVQSPGYYYTSTDAVLRDVIMRAGGLKDADINRIVIRRGGTVVVDHAITSAALADGRPIDTLGLQPGDELYVPEARHVSWSNIIAVGATALAATVAILQVTR